MIALIAGTGSLPIIACQTLQQRHQNFVVVNLFPESNKELTSYCATHTIPEIAHSIVKPSAILHTLQHYAVNAVVLLGKVDKRLLLKKIAFDFFAVSFLAKTLVRSDQALMAAVVDLFNQYGITVLAQHDVLPGLHTKPGILTGSLNTTMKTTIDYGMSLARELATLDVGQTIVVKDMMVLAVEAIEGTDECIKRGIALGNSDVIICKTAHKKQNLRFDLPTLGPATLESLTPGQVQAIVWDHATTLVANQPTFIKQAQELGIALVSYEYTVANNPEKELSHAIHTV